MGLILPVLGQLGCGWGPGGKHFLCLVKRAGPGPRHSHFGQSELIHDSLEFFKSELKKPQPHLRMLFVKTLTNAWHTSSRMHEAICLPCIFGCSALPRTCLAPIHANLPNKNIRDETAHYLACPILSGLITQATGLNRSLTMHELIFGNDIMILLKR